MAQIKLSKNDRKQQIEDQINVLYEMISELESEYEYLNRPGFYIPTEGFTKVNKVKNVKISKRAKKA